MQGREVFRHAVTNLASVLGEVRADVGLSADAIDWIVPHQANKRIIDATAQKLGLPAEHVVLTVDQHANTSAASVPLALDLAMRDGRIKRGDLVVLEAMGGGINRGAAVLRVRRIAPARELLAPPVSVWRINSELLHIRVG